MIHTNTTSLSQPEPITFGALLERLDSVRVVGEGRAMARCPAHGDRTASLSVREGDDGRVLLHDFGGCEFREVVAALGLDERQLFRRSEPWLAPRRRHRPDPAAERAREVLELWARLHEIRAMPSEERRHRELLFVGRVLRAGTKGMNDLVRVGVASEIRSEGRVIGFTTRLVTWHAMKILLEAVGLLHLEGPHWLAGFPPNQLGREITRWTTKERARELLDLARLAIRIAASAAKGAR